MLRAGWCHKRTCGAACFGKCQQSLFTWTWDRSHKQNVDRSKFNPVRTACPCNAVLTRIQSVCVSNQTVWARTAKDGMVSDCEERSRAAAGGSGFGPPAAGSARSGVAPASGWLWPGVLGPSFTDEAHAGPPERTLPICACSGQRLLSRQSHADERGFLVKCCQAYQMSNTHTWRTCVGKCLRRLASAYPGRGVSHSVSRLPPIAQPTASTSWPEWCWGPTRDIPPAPHNHLDDVSQAMARSVQKVDGNVAMSAMQDLSCLWTTEVHASAAETQHASRATGNIPPPAVA